MRTSLASRRSFGAAFVILLFSLGTGLPAFAAEAPPAPWYAARLGQLGFQVFATPVSLTDYQVEALAGGKLAFSSLKGKIVLLNFWATWCPPCREEMPSIEKLWNRLKAEPFTVLAVSTGEARATVAKFIAAEKYSFPVFLDPAGSLGAAFNARSIPTTYLLDKEGRAIAGRVGGLDYDDPAVVGLIEELAKR